MPRRPPPAHSYATPAFNATMADSGALLAVLGPTNTGKTYFAIERLLAHKSGMIGLPLRLLAREVYDKLIARVEPRDVALVTGEEKIIPPNARYWISTVEAMPLERDVEFVAIDEIQLAADMERGRIFTSRLFQARGTKETVFLGAHSMARILKRLFPHVEFLSRERFSALTYAGSKKVTRLPRRSAIVSFSADTVYAIAELVRRQRGGAAVVLGALSPRTRNAQAELYQSGEVDYLIATDAIGMGLNMDIDHVAFSAKRKFDGRKPRDLRADELAQIAGRAGRHIKNGTFGVTADCREFDDDVVNAIEEHQFAPVEVLQWRSDRLDFSTLQTLRQSLNKVPPDPLLKRARAGEDERALDRFAADPEVRDRTTNPATTALLWEVCQTPDFRKSAFDQHALILSEIYQQLIDDGRIAERWLAPKVEQLSRVDGDIDTISARIAHIRTWTYLANRAHWMENASYWQAKTRSIEDALSDALHEKLTQRFVDRRTSVLLKKLRDDAPLLAGVTEDGDVIVEGQFIGRLLGFEFILDPRASGAEAKRVRMAADKALTPVLAARAAALANAEAGDLTLENNGAIRWRASTVAWLEKGPTPFRPNLMMRGLDAITPTLRGRVQDRLTEFLAARVEALLGDLLKLKAATDSNDETLNGLARGIGFRLVENFGAMSRAPIAGDLKQLQQEDRGKLRKLGVRFGEYSLHMPSLLKPAPARLLTMLWALWTERKPAEFDPPKPGLVSLPTNTDLPHAYYYASGYRPSGDRAVRIDMLERLAGIIRTAREAPGGREGFEATSQMMSLVGCSGEEFESILRSLGFRKNIVKRAKAPPPEKAKETEKTEKSPASSGAPNADRGATNDAAAAVEQATTAAAPTDTGPAPSANDNNTAPDPGAQNVPADATQLSDDGATSTADETPAATAEPAGPATDGPNTAPDPTNAIVANTPAGDDATATTASAPTPAVDASATETPDATPNAEKPNREGPGGETAGAESPDPSSEMIEVTLWRMQPRRPQNQNRRPKRDSGGNPSERSGQNARPGQNTQNRQNRTDRNKSQKDAKSGDRSTDRRDGPKGKGRPPHKGKGAKGPQAPRRYESAPRRGKGPDPDSPFAVLAALKGDGASDGKE